jgi:hypothetical protein
VHSWIDVIAFYLAETADDPTNLGVLAQYGVLGVFAIILLVFAKISYKRETDRSDRLEAEVSRLNNVIMERDNQIMERAIPALTIATQAAQDATQLLISMQREQEMDLIRTRRDGPGRSRPGGDSR